MITPGRKALSLDDCGRALHGVFYLPQVCVERVQLQVRLRQYGQVILYLVGLGPEVLKLGHRGLGTHVPQPYLLHALPDAHGLDVELVHVFARAGHLPLVSEDLPVPVPPGVHGLPVAGRFRPLLCRCGEPSQQKAIVNALGQLDWDDLDEMDDIIYNNIPFDMETTKITDLHPDIFAWLNFLDLNILIVKNIDNLIF